MDDVQDHGQSEDGDPPTADRIRARRMRFECDLCGQAFFKKHRIEAHLRKHLGLKPFRCDDCGVSFRKFCSLRSHQRRQHPTDGSVPTRFGPKKFACTAPGCQRAYTERSSLNLHFQKKHSDSPPISRLVCEACGQVCPSNSALQEHMWRHRDPAEYPHACELCPKRFINKYAFQTHLNRHRNIRNFQCTMCDARAYTKAELGIHMAYHNKLPTVVCDRCPDKRFTTKSEYGRCGWGLNHRLCCFFLFLDGLRRHVKIIHEGRKPYVCEDCGLGFSTKHVMKNHRLRHTGEKPHACPVCDRRFTQLVTMKTHLKVHVKRPIVGDDDGKDSD